MNGRHRAPAADGRTAGTSFRGAVGIGLALVGAQVSTAARVGAVPAGAERPDLPAADSATAMPEPPAPYLDRTEPGRISTGRCGGARRRGMAELHMHKGRVVATGTGRAVVSSWVAVCGRRRRSGPGAWSAWRVCASLPRQDGRRLTVQLVPQSGQLASCRLAPPRLAVGDRCVTPRRRPIGL